MLHKLILMIMLALVLNSAKAQHYFNERNSVHSYQSLFTSVLPQNGRFYCTGICVDSVNVDTTYDGVKFVAFDSAGHITRDTVYQQSGKQIDSWASDLYALGNGKFLLMAHDIHIADTSNNAIFMEIDSAGNVLWSKEYEQPFCPATKFYLTTDFKSTGTGNWLLLSNIDCRDISTYQADFAVTKLDSDFNVLWTQYYGDASLNDVPTKILIQSDGYVLTGGQDNANLLGVGSGIPITYRGEMIKIDTNGVQQWTWITDTSISISSIEDIVGTKDSGYMVCGAIELEVEGWVGWIAKLNKYRNIVWSDTIGISPADLVNSTENILKALPNGDIIVAGILEGGFIDTVGWMGVANFATLVKYDAGGNMKWRRKYNITGDTLLFRVFDMKPTEDGGYVLAGDASRSLYYAPPPVDRSWILKVDSNGCMSATDPQCHPVNVINNTAIDARIKVYPNPVKNGFTVHYYFGLREDGQIEITDIAGREMQQTSLPVNKTEVRIDANEWVPGIYLYRVQQQGHTVSVGKIIKE